MKIENVGIVGIGSYTPVAILTNESIDLSGIGTNSEWTKKNLGIEERRISYIKTSDMAYESGIRAISDAGLKKEDIDLILLATSSPDRISPSTACILGGKLGVTCPALDINAVCSGFVYGLQLATNLVNTGQYRNVLLVASERYSTITDWDDRNCVFFGDGSGAVVVSNSINSWVSTDIFSDGSGSEHFTCHHSEKFIMNGKAVFDFGTKILPKTIKDSLNNVNLNVDDISWLVPHQPSINILKKTAEKLNLPIERVVLNMMKFANTAGASIPMALDKLYISGKLKNNNIIVMPAVGSGWTWGVSIVKYCR